VSLTFQNIFIAQGLVPHDVMTLSLHCGVAVLASCLDQWGQTDFPNTISVCKARTSTVKMCYERNYISNP